MQAFTIRESISQEGREVRDVLTTAPSRYIFDNQLGLIVQRKFISPEWEDLTVKIKLQPFQILLNQQTVLFLQRFFDISFPPKQVGQELSQSKVECIRRQEQGRKKFTLSRLIISETSVTLSYTSEKLHLVDLASGSLIELLNLVNLSNLVIDLREYDILRNKAPMDIILKGLLKFYIRDLLQNQKVNFARALGPIRSLVNLTGALYTLIERPYSGFTSNKGVVRGMGEGLTEFYSVLAEEGVFIATKLLSIVK